MFYCKTQLSCDICGKGSATGGSRMSDCASKQFFRLLKKREGWSVYYGRYDVCKDCREHYGSKEIRRMIKEKHEQKEEFENGYPKRRI